MKCPQCQAENWDTDTQCSNCGASLVPGTRQTQQTSYRPQQEPPRSFGSPPGSYQSQPYQRQAPIDKLNPLLGILAFFMPIIGFILYFVWKDEKPQSARTVGMIALIAFGLTMMFYACVGCVAVSSFD